MDKANSNEVLTTIDLVDKFMKNHNRNCRSGLEIPDKDYLSIRDLLIEFYSKIKD